jgi:nitroreductase
LELAWPMVDTLEPMSARYEDLLELMQTRRSVRRFRGDALAPELLPKLLDAARWAPSAANRACYRLIPLEAPALIAAVEREISRASTRLRDGARDEHAAQLDGYLEHCERFGGAPLVLAQIVRLGPDLLAAVSRGGAESKTTEQQGLPRPLIDSLASASAALQNLLLAAHALGLGACWMTGPLIASEALTALLEVPRGWQLVALVPLGYAAEQPSPPPRKPAERLLRRPPKVAVCNDDETS